PLRIAVSRNDDAIADEKWLAMKFRGRAVRPGVVEPDRSTGHPVERVERAGARPDDDRVADDRRRDEHSTVRLEAPQCIPGLCYGCALAGAQRRESQGRYGQDDKERSLAHSSIVARNTFFRAR